MGIINIGLLLFIVFLLVILSWVWPPDSPWSPWWRTSARKATAAAKLASIKKSDKVYELGSGEATFLVTVAKTIGARGVGIEIDYTRHWFAKINALINGVSELVELKRGNFNDLKIKDADVVFVYLVPRVLERLKPKLIRELKKGTKVVSLKYKFQPGSRLSFIKSDVKNSLHLYKIV